ncbi:MAG: thioredoxin family protein [Isosphaeraceae bacterium]
MRGGLRRVWSVVCILSIGAGAASAQEKAKTPAKPASPAKRASIYDKTADARTQIAKATARAKEDNQRVLLMFGGDWCGWCHKLHGLFTSNRQIAQTLFNEYVFVTVDTEAPNAKELLERCKAALSEDESKRPFGYPFLAVLDAEGKVVKAQQTDVLEEGDHHNPARVQEFLDGWKVPPKDAKLVLEEALSRAASDDKRVLLTFGAPWCGWCHKLHDWLAQPEVAAILDRDFVIAQVDVDRMIGGKDIQKQYQPATSAGIPWFAILDTKGKPLSTSDAPTGNIGYPAQPQEIKDFLSMIKSQGRRIDEGQLDQLRKSLEEAAERIKRPTSR